jgi:4-hydroxybenzoate polyprenyltransferase
MFKHVISLMRPHQWLKNLFVFLPMFFSGNMHNGGYWSMSFLGFCVFCFAASSVYALNDLLDVVSDRKHPIKCKRPLASGAISRKMAIAISVVNAIFALGVSALIPNKWALGVTGLYLFLNVAYCFWLKHIAIVDVLIVSFGFVLRLLLGGLATGIQLSQWIVLMTYLLALFLAVAKRRDDVIMFEQEGTMVRQNIQGYNLPFVSLAMGVLAAVMIVCYIMYTVSPDVIARLQTRYLYITTLFVVAGILRYLQLTLVEGKSGSPTKVLIRDTLIQCCLLAWVLVFVIIIYC